VAVSSGTLLVDDLRALADRLADVLAPADPSSSTGAQAAEVVELCCRVKRLSESSMARFARRVEETGAFSTTGHRSAAEWLGERAGETPSSARSRLTTAALSADVPALDAAFTRGDVSADQARVIAQAVAADPTAVSDLLATAADQAMGSLRDAALAVRHRALSAASAAARRAHVHRRRYLRWATEPSGGIRGSFLVDEAAWGRCLDAIETLAERRFAAGRDAGVFESRDAYRIDALVARCTRGGAQPGPAGPGAMVQLRVDVESLHRGHTEGDEVCEIVGIGPVPVVHARSLLGDCVFDVLVRDKVDVCKLTGTGRSIPERLRRAVLRRDQHCRWGSCREAHGLQIHHWRLDAALGEIASLDTLVTLCQAHHDFCTYGGWRIEPVPGTGGYRTVPPDDPLPRRFIERKRKLAVRRAEARRAGAQPPLPAGT
jgi:hypothetical protein